MFYIAFCMLVGDRGKFLGIILGLAFSSLIMTQQPGVFLGILSRSYSFITDLDFPDIWVMDPTVQYIDDNKPMLETKLYSVSSVRGIQWAKPLYKGTIQARLQNGVSQTCNLIGIDDETMIGAPPIIIKGKLSDLRQIDSIIVNLEGANEKLANPPATPKDRSTPLQVGQVFELNDKRAIVVGIAQTTRTFQSQPIIYTTYTRAKSYAPPQRNLLTYILVKAMPGENLEKLCDRIKKQTGLQALTKSNFKKLTMQYYLNNTSLVINFGVSIFLGFLVGAAIAGQAFYTFTLENLRYFGVLKAMGSTQKDLLKMIIFQALITGFIGYGIGIGTTSLFAFFTQKSQVAFRFPWELFIISLIGIIFILLCTALLSIRRVLKLEPAIVFKS